MTIEMFFKYLPDFIRAAQSLPRIMTFINETKANFQARGEWTREKDEEFTQTLENWDPQI